MWQNRWEISKKSWEFLKNGWEISKKNLGILKIDWEISRKTWEFWRMVGRFQKKLGNFENCLGNFKKTWECWKLLGDLQFPRRLLMKEFPVGLITVEIFWRLPFSIFVFWRLFWTTEEVPRRKEGVQHLRVASCVLTTDFPVVFALLIVEAKASLVVDLFGPLFYGRTFSVRPLVILGPGEVCSMSHCYILLLDGLNKFLCGVFCWTKIFCWLNKLVGVMYYVSCTMCHILCVLCVM